MNYEPIPINDFTYNYFMSRGLGSELKMYDLAYGVASSLAADGRYEDMLRWCRDSLRECFQAKTTPDTYVIRRPAVLAARRMSERWDRISQELKQELFQLIFDTIESKRGELELNCLPSKVVAGFLKWVKKTKGDAAKGQQ